MMTAETTTMEATVSKATLVRCLIYADTSLVTLIKSDWMSISGQNSPSGLSVML